MNRKITLVSLVLLAIVIAACGGASPNANVATRSDGEMVAQDNQDSMAQDDMANNADSNDSMVQDDMAGDVDSNDSMAQDDMAGDVDSNDSMAQDDVAGDVDSNDSMAQDDVAGDMADDGDMDSSDSMAEGEAAAMNLPAWFQAELTDVNSGQTFTLADLRGKVVLVETMAIWCPTCLRQQQEVQALHQALGEREDLVTVVLDIDPNEDAASLKSYADKHGFAWLYAVAPRDVAREIGQLYGDQFLNPPSTPMLIVDRHGAAHPLPFGRKTAADLEEALAPFLEDGM